MRKNLLLILAIFVSILLAYNSFQKISDFKGTSSLVTKEEERLEALRLENEQLKMELEYKKSDRFQEEEIRNKLGLAKEGEEIVVLPKDEQQSEEKDQRKRIANWKKWKVLIFGS